MAADGRKILAELARIQWRREVMCYEAGVLLLASFVKEGAKEHHLSEKSYPRLLPELHTMHRRVFWEGS
jgi:hypothetical protein